MGARGPAKTPTALVKLRGNPGRRRLPKGEPKPSAAAVVDPPAWLRAEAKQEWYAILPALKALGLYTEVDRAALANYCIAYADLQIAERELQLKGDTQEIVTKSGLMEAQSPWVFIKNRAQVQCNKWAREFGFTPASRASLATGESGEDDELSAWRKSRG